ncbi:MAG: vitamin B12 dependent-methionine synthase activation domain-containing protein [Bacillota bacterium]|nr:vitamin B12 dependent-methionine synthase activation domain-containing protein [Bacillota bacterium]
MNIKLPEQINRADWLLYLQVKGEPDLKLTQQMDEAERILLQTATPRGIYRVLDIDDIATDGVSIKKHLEGCDRAAAFAVTLGSEIDALINRSQITNMALAVLLDTGASVLADQAADAAEQSIRSEITDREDNIYFTPRFSPGYGDYPITRQRDMLAYLDAARKIGLTLTSADMLVPTKSITAVVGLADHPVTGRLATCGECVLRDKCEFWRSGNHC